MSNLVAAQQGQYPAFAMPEEELIDTLRSSLYPSAADKSIKMVVSWCKANGKDPFKKPVHIVPMSVKVGVRQDGRAEYGMRDIIMRGIEDYRMEAARTGQYGGIARIDYGADVALKAGEFSIMHPEWCEFVVIRLVQGARCEFTSGRIYWVETYATKGRDSKVPNDMWAKRPRGQLEKCAEAMALRRAFPEAIGGDPTMEEMEGRVIDISPVDEHKPAGVEMPKPKSEPVTIDQPKRTEPPAPASTSEDRPATDGEKNHIRAKLAGAGITEDVFTEVTNLTIDTLTLNGFKEAKRRIAEEPGDFLKPVQPETESADV